MRGGSVLLVSYTQFKHTVLNMGVRLCWRRGESCVINQQVSQKILAEEQILYQAARIPDLTVHQQ